MFSKRRRAASNPPQSAPPSASASLAATTAFVRDRESNANLSNAAAAAALRTHIATPTPVGDTVTKRMIRRSSLSSNGSPRPPPGPLRRQSSSGSMSERSFRAPSPGRGSPAEPTAPPVPPVPKSIAENGAVQRRASSLEPAWGGGSLAPTGGGRGASVDRVAQNTAGRGQRPMNPLANVSEEDAAAAQRSINFSRPMSPSTPTPPKLEPSPQSAKGWFGGPVVNQEAVQQMTLTSPPKISSAISGHDLETTHQSIRNAVDRPVKKHQLSHSVEGSRLANGSMRAKPSGTAVQPRSFLQPAPRQPPRIVDPKSPDAIYDPSSRTFIHKQDAMALHRELHQEPEQLAHHYAPQHVDDYHTPHLPQQQQQQQQQQQPTRRAPAPVRQSLQREASPASQRSKDAVLPRLDTTSRDRAPYTPETHVDTELEQHNPEEFADVDFQFPAQANTGRKLDNTVLSAEPEPVETFRSPATNQDSSYPHSTTPSLQAPKTTVPDQDRGSLRTGHDRQASLSPPRNAHFASMTVELAGEKHQPPPRSVSPAKSALKSSPSISRRGSSPVAPNGCILSKGASSEASDTTSDDGLKRRRNVRVSFEETPIIAGTSGYTNAETPTSLPGLQASRWSPIAEKENEFEDLMKPRAALPVFGSIREKERRPTHDDVAEKVTETVSSTPMSASVGSIGEPLHSSNDYALGNIITQDFARKQGATSDPLPPEVTSVEGSGHVSDSSEESDLGKHSDALSVSQPLPIPEPKSLTTPLDEKSSTPGSAVERIVEVPHIALLPATPSPYEKPEPVFQSMAIPGGWDEEDREQTVKTAVSPTTPTAIPTPPVVEPPCQPSPLPSEEEDSSDDGSSVYSDAYEELTDTEGGFGSIDAMVESPVIPSSSGLMASKYADKGVTETPHSKLRNETTTDNDTDSYVAEQRGSEPNTSRMQPQDNVSYAHQQLHAQDVVARMMQSPVTQQEPVVEREIASAPINKLSTPPQVSQPSPKPLKSALKKAAVVQPTQQAEPQMRKSTRGPAPRHEPSSEPQMRKTMRGGTSPVTRAEPQMRSSMRGSPDPAPRVQPQMRKSMREVDPPGPTSPGLAASRHSMLPVETKPRGALQKRNIPAAVVAPKPRPQSMSVVKQAPAPVPTYDSDSDASASSFQRTRARGNRNQGGRYTMRSSMRSEPAPTMRATAPTPMSRQVRPISLPVSPAPAIRKSMRPSPTPELTKSSKFRLRSLSPIGRFRSSKDPDVAPPSPIKPKKMTMPTFSKQAKQKTPAAPRSKAPKNSIKSRFADSSDEDDDAPSRRFQSRFADSDSDDEDYKLPPDLAPVRGIPRRAGEEDGDSTDLEEEADDEKATTSVMPDAKTGPATTKTTKDQTNGNANGKGAALSAGSLRDSKHASTLPTFEAAGKEKTKRGFFGLGKKKVVATQPDAAPPASATDDAIPEPPAQRNREPGLPLTPIDEDKDIGTSVSPSPQTKKASKLQRRSTPEWPLPSPPAIGIEERPMSSDGVAPRRPHFQNRQSSTTSNNTAPAVDVQGRSMSYGKDGKKKKFQGLRRVFGIND